MRSHVDKIAQCNFYSGPTVTDVVRAVIEDIYNKGKKNDSRNGEVRYLTDVTMEFTNPLARHLNIKGRKSNIFQLIAETFWVCAGEEKLSPYLVHFLPRAPQYSDDGETWHDAYGPRLLGNATVSNQLQNALELLKSSPVERRAYCSIYDPARDTTIARAEAGVTNPKAIPCNLGLIFWIEYDELKMKVWQRSGDMFFGAGSINPFEFSFIHELMYTALLETYPTLKMGTYRHNVINAHLYTGMEVINKQLENIVVNGSDFSWESGLDNATVSVDSIPLVEDNPFTNWDDIKVYFMLLVRAITSLITEPVGSNANTLETLKQHAISVDTKQEHAVFGTDYSNMLKNYASAVMANVLAENGWKVSWVVSRHNNMMVTNSFETAIRDSSFRKFTFTISDER